MKKTKEKFVETIKGELLPISKTKKYDSGFYKIGNIYVKNSGDCYVMDDGKCYREETGQICFDHTLNKYVFNKNLHYGVIDSNLNMGYFSQDNPLTINKKDYGYCPLLNEEIIKNNLEYRECISDGIYHHITTKKALDFNIKKVPSREYKESLNYDSKDCFREYVESYNNNYLEKHEVLPEILEITKGLSFGLEFETTKGMLSQNVCKNLGLIPLRDGSITGIEYASVPLEGSKGMSAIVDMIKELNKRTEYDDNCSLHLHIGNVPRTMSFILAFYKVTCMIQDSIFEMFPLYKKYNFGFKNKNYAAPYDALDKFSKMDSVINSNNLINNFDILFKELSGGYGLRNYEDDGSLQKVTHHVNDPQGNHKWNVKSRYHIHNLTPLLFGNKQTIEFRIHTPTYDLSKIMWFICLNSLIVKYVEKFETEILANKKSITLENVILDVLYNLNVKDSFINSFLTVKNKRKEQVYSFNRQSKMFFKEEEIFIKFNYLKNNSSKSTNNIHKSLTETIFEIEKIRSRANDASIDFSTLRVHMNNNIYYYDPISPEDSIEKPELENIDVVKEVAKDYDEDVIEKLDKSNEELPW